MRLHKDTIPFLKDLARHNDRDWFNANRARYEEAYGQLKKFVSFLLSEMKRIDSIEKHKIFRIYKDVRFSKDKSPYNKHFSVSYTRSKPYLRGGYYLRIEPGDSLVACGFWDPSPSDLELIRQNISIDSDRFKKATSYPLLKSHFEGLHGEEVKTAPKGYSKHHPQIELIRKKQFIFYHKFSDQEVQSPDFGNKVVKHYAAIRPFFDYMSEILSHDLNGIPLY